MKIVIVINSLATGGAEKLVLDTIPKFIERGITVELLLLNGTEHPFLTKMKEEKQCSISVLSNGSVYNPFLIFKIIPFLKKNSLVHVHLFPAIYWVVFAKVISFSKCKLFLTEHNTTNRRKGIFFAFMDKRVYRKYEKLIAITDEINEILKNKFRFQSSKFVKIHNGVDLQKIQNAIPANKEDFGLKMSDKVIIQVSSFTPQKDQQTLIKAINKLPSHIHLLLVGDGPSKTNCITLAEKLKIKDRVHFLGLRMDVPNLLKMADIVVLSSHFEGLSLASIEGMISGKPFVASRVPGLQNLVEGAGILVEENNDAHLAEEIQHLLNDTLYYSQKVTNCQERAKEFGLEKMVTNYISLYNQVWESQN
ncbi:MAG: glycosyltransferase [Flavobacteriaceae bacterium]|nr:glycosyltransferase [Flavobacteriaceae bacterium]